MRRHPSRIGLLLLTALLVSGCGSTHLASRGTPAIAIEAGSVTQVEVQRLPRQTYTPSHWPEALEAEVYLPITSNDSLRPAALVVHGGGWQNRGLDDMASIAERLATRGYVVVNVEHRFAPEYRFPAQLHDLQEAMTWLQDHADAWQVDTDRIVGVGYSSGAHLVSLLALTGTEGSLATTEDGKTTRIVAVLAGGLPSDLFKFPDGRLVVEFLGGTRAEVPDQYLRASPAHHVTAVSPLFFLFHGVWDQLVPVDHAIDFYAELQAKNVESELYLQHLRGHFASFLTRDKAIEAGIAFLDRQVKDR
jgi:acetyl esterase/lipase